MVGTGGSGVFFVNGSRCRQNDGACYRKDFGISTVGFKTVRVCARDQSRGSTVLSDCHDGDGPPSVGRPAEHKPPEARRKSPIPVRLFGGLFSRSFVPLSQKQAEVLAKQLAVYNTENYNRDSGRPDHPGTGPQVSEKI